MTRLIKRIVILLVYLSVSVSSAQQPAAIISPPDRIVLPVVGPIAATFTHDGMIVVQSDGITKHQRSVSLWNSKEHTWSVSKVIGPNSPAEKGRWNDCVRTAYLKSTNTVVVCGSPSQLLVVDGDTLDVKQQITLDKWTNTYDFEITDDGQHVYTVGLTRGRGVTITKYVFSSGELLMQTALTDFDDYYPISLAKVQSGHTVNLAVYGSKGGGSRGMISVCQDDDSLSCKNIKSTEGVGQVQFLGSDKALFVTSSFADRSLESKHECIKSLSVKTFQINQRAYCAQTGVHYALAILKGHFVIGYSGYGTYNAITENSKNLNDSVSVWSSESGPV